VAGRLHRFGGSPLPTPSGRMLSCWLREDCLTKGAVTTGNGIEPQSAAAIRKRLSQPPKQSHLRDFIYGGIDGTVTTFAVVAGVAGAQLSATVVIILGVANLIADGFSMGVSNFLATRAERQERDLARSREEREVRELPDEEREEIRQIFLRKGFSGDDLDRVVDVITSDPRLWVDTMMAEEHGYGSVSEDAMRAAISTFTAFVIVGSIPLIAFIADGFFPSMIQAPFVWSSVMTGVAFFVVGALKSRFVAQRWWLAGLETLVVGGAAAVIAYGLGSFLERIV
jgi:vacuolar iron transporter family protein